MNMPMPGGQQPQRMPMNPPMQNQMPMQQPNMATGNTGAPSFTPNAPAMRQPMPQMNNTAVNANPFTFTKPAGMNPVNFM